MTDAPPTPAGWYDDPSNPALLKYWDGLSWTEHTSPKIAAPVPGGSPQGMSSTKKVLIIAGSVVGGLILISGVASAVGGEGEMNPPAVAQSAVETTRPTSTPSSTPTSTPTLTPVVFDPIAFRTEAHSHLDDMTKDLDDMVITLDEGGFWRLLSNSFELSFNLAQLRALEVPSPAPVAWADGLNALEVSMDALDAPIAGSDDAGTRAAIEGVRAQIASLHVAVDQVQ